MADFLTDLASYLIENGIGSGIGEDIFLDYRPEKPDRVIVLTEYSGFRPQRKVDVVNRRVQILVRDKNYEYSKSLIWKIFNLLNDPEKDEIFTPSGRWMITSPLQTPSRLNIDDKNRSVYVYNLGVVTTKDQ